MCSHGCFFRGNEKQTRTTSKNINFVRMLPYMSPISYWVPNLVFLGGSGEGGAYLKRGAYSKFKTLRGALTWSGALIWSWALIRAFTVYFLDKTNFVIAGTECDKLASHFDTRKPFTVNKFSTQQKFLVRKVIWKVFSKGKRGCVKWQTGKARKTIEDKMKKFNCPVYILCW